MSRWWWSVVFIFVFTSSSAAQQSVLDRTLTTDALGEPVVWLPTSIDNGIFALRIATASQVPLVFEAAPIPTIAPAGQQRLVLTGKTVRAALDLLVAADARYTWSETNGVIVVRPLVALTDASNPFNAAIANVVWDNVSVPQAMDGVASSMAGGTTPPEPRETPFDDHLFSVTVPSGSVLDVLIECARAHGALIWTTPDPTGEHNATGLSIRVTTFDGRSLGADVPVLPQ
jgi:hypothetical protein